MRVVNLSVIVVVAAVLFSCSGQGVTKKSLDTELDSVSYAIGLDMATSLKTGFEEVDQDLLVQGIKNGLSSEEAMIEESAIKSIISFFVKLKLNPTKLNLIDLINKYSLLLLTHTSVNLTVLQYFLIGKKRQK